MVAWGFKPILSNFRVCALNHYCADSIGQTCGFLARSAKINSAFPFSWTASPAVSFGNDFLCWLFLFGVVVRLRNRRGGLLRLSSSQVVTGSLSFALLCLTTLWFLTSYRNQNLWYGDKKLLTKMEGFFFFFFLSLLKGLRVIILSQLPRNQAWDGASWCVVYFMGCFVEKPIKKWGRWNRARKEDGCDRGGAAASERGPRRRAYMYPYSWFTSLYCRN